MLPIDATHELLAANRVFMWPVSPIAGIGWVQINPLWAFRTNNGIDGATDWGWNQGSNPSLRTGANAPGGTPAAYYSYWNDVWPDADQKDITVIARARYTGSDPGGGGGSFIAGARDPGNGGWLFGVWDSGGTDEGLSLFLYDQSGNVWVATDQDSISTMIGTPHVYAAVYRSNDRQVAFYRSGMRTRTVTNAAHDWTPWISTGSKQFTIGRADAGFIFPGDIGWVMVFARALGDADIMALTRDDQWPFVWDDPLFILEDASATYTTQVTVNSALAVTVGAETVTFVTGVDAEAIVDGDFSIEPDPPAVGTFRTQIGVGSTVYLDTPEFGVFVTVVGVNSQITSTSPVTYITRVGVRSDARGLIDGRTDLIGTEHYRR